MAVTNLDRRLRMGDMFDSLRPEEEIGEDKTVRVETSLLEDFIRLFGQAFISDKKEYLKKFTRGETRNPKSIENFYQHCLDFIPQQYSNEDVNRFLQFYATQITQAEGELPHNLENKLGLYVSSLINNSDEQNWIIELPWAISHKSWLTELGFVGYRNDGKNITLKCFEGARHEGKILRGSPGEGTGMLMKSGKLKINNESSYQRGDIGRKMLGGEIYFNGIGHYGIGERMEGGVIRVERNLGDNLTGIGYEMHGGSIFVNSDVKRVGFHMKGGEIVINGCVSGDLCRKMQGGKVTVKGHYKKTPGKEMSGGEIYIISKYFPLPKSAIGGSIYRNGKIVMRDGRKVR